MKFALLSFLLLSSFVLSAKEKVKFSTSTDKKSYYDFENVQLTCKIENGDFKQFQLPALNDFDVVGRYQQNHSGFFMEIVNGQQVTKKNESFELIFSLKPKRKGVLNIPKLSVKYDGQTYSAPGISVEVKSLSVSQAQSSKDRFIKVEVSKSSPYLGEAFTLTYTLFTTDEIKSANQFKNLEKLKNFEDFTAKEIGEMSSSGARLNGKNYQIIQLGKFLMLPASSGKIKIPAFTLDYISYKYTRRNLIFTTSEEVERKAVAPARTINVKALPSTSLNFSGLVGDFSLSRKIDKETVDVNDAITATYTLKGTGNFNVLDELPLTWSSVWEVFDPKRNVNYKEGGKGFSGALSFENVAIPRGNGTQEIPGIDLVYFNPSKGKYMTTSVSPQEIEVTGEAATSAGGVVYDPNSKNVEIRGKDIRYIHHKEDYDKASEFDFIGSGAHFATSGVAALGFLYFMMFYVRKEKTDDEIAEGLKKNAKKKALKVLASAKTSLDANDDQFYAVMEQAMNNFFMDRYGLNAENVNRTDLTDAMRTARVGEVEIEQYLKLYESCGLARYSPVGVEKGDMYKQVEQMMVNLA